MKFLIILLLTTSFKAFGWAISVGGGGLTPHFNSSKRHYCNQWNDTGIIANRSQYLQIAWKNYMITFMEGEDSICSPIDGGFFTWGFKFTERYDMGLIIGYYNYVQENWDRHAANTPEGVDAPSPFTITIDGSKIVPVFGLQLGIHLIKGKKFSLILNNILTPVIFNHSLALQYRF